MKTKNPSEIVVDAKDIGQIASLGDWCRANLTDKDYDFIVMTMFPLWIRFKFRCDKTSVLALLST